jgi:hypothetical protein
MAGHGFPERRAKTRYPIELPLRYQTLRSSSAGGIGMSVNFSSHGLLISAASAQIPARGSRVDVVVEWPVRLGGKTPLQFVISGQVVRSETANFAILFEGYEFRTMKRRIAK